MDEGHVLGRQGPSVGSAEPCRAAPPCAQRCRGARVQLPPGTALLPPLLRAQLGATQPRGKACACPAARAASGLGSIGCRRRAVGSTLPATTGGTGTGTRPRPPCHARGSCPPPGRGAGSLLGSPGTIRAQPAPGSVPPSSPWVRLSQSLLAVCGHLPAAPTHAPRAAFTDACTRRASTPRNMRDPRRLSRWPRGRSACTALPGPPTMGARAQRAQAARGRGEPLQPPGSSALPAPPAGRGARGSAGDAQHTAGRALAHLSEHLNLPALYDRAIQLLSCPVGICASFKSYKPKTL